MYPVSVSKHLTTSSVSHEQEVEYTFNFMFTLFSDDQSNSNLSENKASQASDEDEDEMVTEALQFNQLSLEEFCIILLSRVVTMFQGSLCTDSAIIESAVNLMHKVQSLMRKVFPDDLWRGGTKLNSLMVSEDDTCSIIMHVVVIFLKII